MRRFIFTLALAGSFIATAVYGLPAPSSLSAREKHAVAPRATPAPRPQTPTAVIPESSRLSTVVVIDAGHGGFDRGGIPGQRVLEKNMTLDVAQRLKAVLTAYGYRVVMTRDSDVFVPLGTRVAIANSYRDAIFVCIHFNATRRGSANGIETYFYSSQSLPLASAIHYYVARGAPTPNRGVRRRGFYVLRKRRFRQCWLNAASLPTRPKRITPRVLPTSRNSRKKSAVVSANARSLPAPQRLTVSPPTIRRSRSSRSSIKLITATRTLPDRSAAREARRVRQNRHRRSASILPTRIRRKGARPEKRNRPPRKRRISWNRPC